MSQYEEIIVKLLKQAHIPFEREKRFIDLKGGRYRFDFYLTSGRPICIEVDGEQHFHQVTKFQKTYSEFLKTREHDRQKNSYCLSHNILLYRIPYWELQNLRSASDIFNQKFLVGTKWHNDYIKLQKKN